MVNPSRRSVLFGSVATATVAVLPSTTAMAGSFADHASEKVAPKHVPGTHDVEPDWFEVLGIGN